MVLTGEIMNAEEAASAGLVAKVLPDNTVLNVAIEYGVVFLKMS
jgi:enoyl-CoA hydratase/carnithine racemase